MSLLKKGNRYLLNFAHNIILGNVADAEQEDDAVNKRQYDRGISIINSRIDDLPSGGSMITGQNFLIVQTADIDTSNQLGAKLLAVLAAAKLVTPNGSALSASNRIAIIIPPGIYNCSATLALDTQFIDLIGLTDNREDVIIKSTSGYTVTKTANDILLKNINIQNAFSGCIVSGDYSNEKFENVIFSTTASGLSTMPLGNTCSGTYTDCLIRNSFAAAVTEYAFGGGLAGVASGTFTRCKYVTTSGATPTTCLFGGLGTASGSFIDCEVNNSASIDISFGGGGGAGTNYATGVFTRCKSYSYAGSEPFGAFGEASGTFTDCYAELTNNGIIYAFGGGSGGVASGIFIRCTASCSGTMVNRSFGGGTATASGNFKDCSALHGASGSYTNSSVMSGIFDNHVNSDGRWAPTTFSGTLKNTELTARLNYNCVQGVVTGAKFINNTLRTSGTGVPLYSAGAQNAVIAHCRMSVAESVNITNLIGTPYNVVDADL